VEDIRNSKVADVVKELLSYGVNVEVTDPKADSDELKLEYGFDLIPEIGKNYDAVIVAVNHAEFLNHDEDYFQSIMSKDALVVDLKGIYKGRFKKIGYWSL
jgi:UDP-N-acetyl-D-galactosamine dehydrogenase